MEQQERGDDSKVHHLVNGQSIYEILTNKVTRISGRVVVLCIAILFPILYGGPVQVQRYDTVLIYILIALGLNLSFGYSGQLSLAQPVAVGSAAYLTGVLGSIYGLNPWVTLVPSIAVGTMLSVVAELPGFRLRGWYLAITTFFAALIFPHVIDAAARYTGGTDGLPGVSALFPGLTGSQADLATYGIVLGFTAIFWLIIYRLTTARWGIRIRSLRDCPMAARSSGVNVGTTRFVVVILASIPVSIAGWLWAHVFQFLTPDSFGLNLVLPVAAAVFIGGKGKQWGPVIGVLIYQIFNLWVEPFNGVNQIFLGLGIVVVIILFPEGIVDAIVRAFEWIVHFGSASKEVDGVVVGDRSSLATAPATQAALSGHAGDTLHFKSEADAEPAPRSGRANSDPSLHGPVHAGGSSSPVLEVVGVHKAFSGAKVLTDVTFEVNAGLVYGLVGPNGAGKTTLLNIITCFDSSDTGEVRVGGVDVTGWTARRVAMQGLRRSFQVPQLIDELSALENVELGLIGSERQLVFGSVVRGSTYRSIASGSRAAAEAICDALNLDRSIQQTSVKKLPLGIRRTIEVARAVVAEPNVVCLDEPAAGLGGEELEALHEVLRMVAARGHAVLLVEHNLSFVADVCDVVFSLDRGKLVGTDTVSQLDWASSSGAPRPTLKDGRAI